MTSSFCATIKSNGLTKILNNRTVPTRLDPVIGKGSVNNIINAIDIMQKKIIDAIILEESYTNLTALVDTSEEQTMALDVGELVITDAKALARNVLTLYKDLKDC